MIDINKAIAATFLFASISINATSFDCNSSSLNSTESAICNDPYELGELDDLLSEFYKYSIEHGNKNGQAKNKQITWTYNRDLCNEDYWCIANAYQSRIKEIAEEEGLLNPNEVKDPVLFTAVQDMEPSLAGLPKCESFPDINNDKIDEKLCHPDNNGAKYYSEYLFASNGENFKFLPEITLGTSLELSILKLSAASDGLKKSLPSLSENSVNGWKILVIEYGSIENCEDDKSYYVYKDDLYIKIFTESIPAPWNSCNESE